ncbi:MAG TPA: hypothetical protein VGE74_00560 [Gemmata sp.]
MRAFAAVGAILVLIGLLGYGLSISDRRRTEGMGTEPERLTLQTLLARGTQGQRNVVVTDFAPCENYVIVKLVTKEYGREIGSKVERCFVPLAPRASGPSGYVDTRPSQIRIAVNCPFGGGGEDTVARCREPELLCLVEGYASALDLGTRQVLAQQYPGTDFDKCLVVTLNVPTAPTGRPGFAQKVVLWLGWLGCGCWAVAAVLALKRRVSPPPPTEGPAPPPPGESAN